MVGRRVMRGLKLLLDICRFGITLETCWVGTKFRYYAWRIPPRGIIYCSQINTPTRYFRRLYGRQYKKYRLQPGGLPCLRKTQKSSSKRGADKQLKNRISRMSGQLNGISRMLDENRFCGDILVQIAAVESALQNLGYIILQDHLSSCVAEEIKAGNSDIIDETVDLIRKLKWVR